MLLSLEVLSDLFAKPDLWLHSHEVGHRLAPGTNDPNAAASAARRREQVFGVWDGASYMYPAFQFDESKRLCPGLRQLLSVLPRDPNGTIGIDAALWAFAPDAALDDRMPAEVFRIDPDRVIELARRRMQGGDG